MLVCDILKLFNAVIIFLHYLLYAFHRFGIDHGARYNRWRALVFFIALQAWLVLIAMAWLKIIMNINLFLMPKWAMFLGAVTLSFADDFFWKNGQEKYEVIFNRLPKHKRAIFDVATALFVIFVFSFMMYSLILVRDAK